MVTTEFGTCPDHGCVLPVVRRGFCDPHSQRFYKRGNPQWDVPLKPPRRKPGVPFDVERDIVAYLVDIPEGCKVWPFARYGDGRGHVKTDQGHEQVHRVVWKHFHGEIPDHLMVLHSCGKGHLGCAWIDHLYLGDIQQNYADAVEHGVMPAEGFTAKLTREQAIEIRRRALAGENQRTLAAEFGVSRSLISMVKTGKVWP